MLTTISRSLATSRNTAVSTVLGSLLTYWIFAAPGFANQQHDPNQPAAVTEQNQVLIKPRDLLQTSDRKGRIEEKLATLGNFTREHVNGIKLEAIELVVDYGLQHIGDPSRFSINADRSQRISAVNHVFIRLSENLPTADFLNTVFGWFKRHRPSDRAIGASLRDLCVKSIEDHGHLPELLAPEIEEALVESDHSHIGKGALGGVVVSYCIGAVSPLADSIGIPRIGGMFTASANCAFAAGLMCGFAWLANTCRMEVAPEYRIPLARFGRAVDPAGWMNRVSNIAVTGSNLVGRTTDRGIRILEDAERKAAGALPGFDPRQRLPSSTGSGEPKVYELTD